MGDEAGLFSAVYLVARVCLAAVFLYSGVTKLLNWQGAVGEMKHFKLPVPELTAAGVIALQLVAGSALVLDIWTVPSALALAVFTVFATMLGHPFWTFKGEDFNRQLTTALEHLGIVGGLILVALVSYSGG